jgi:hypothetical protein
MRVMDRQEIEATERIETVADIVGLFRPGAGLDLPEHAVPLDYGDGVRAAIQMLHAGEVGSREFFELCYEAAIGEDPTWAHLGESA